MKLKILQCTACFFLICGLALFFATAGGIYNHWQIGLKAASYRPATFQVLEVEYQTNPREADYCPIGTGLVEGNIETIGFVRFIRGRPHVSSQAALEKMFPQGSILDVWYNPDASTTLMNGTSPRLIPRSYDIHNATAHALRQSIAWNSLLVVGIILTLFERRLRKQSPVKKQKSRKLSSRRALETEL